MGYDHATREFTRDFRFATDTDTEDGDELTQEVFDEALDELATGMTLIAKQGNGYKTKALMLASGADYTKYSEGDTFVAGQQMYYVVSQSATTYHEITLTGDEGVGGLKMVEAGFIFSTRERATQGYSLGLSTIIVDGVIHKAVSSSPDLTTADSFTYKVFGAIQVPAVSDIAGNQQAWVGATIRATNGYNGEPETFDVVAASTHTSNAQEVIDMPAAGLQAVSRRKWFKTFDEMLADTRVHATSGVTLEVQGLSVYDVVASGNLGKNTAGGNQLDVVSNQDHLDVKAFGAKGDGLSDDLSEIQNALDSDIKGIFFSRSTYKISDGLSITKDKNILMHPSAIIDASSMDASVTLGEKIVVNAAGTIGSPISITSNITENDEIINVSDTTGLSAGDLIFVKSTAVFAAGWTGSNYQGWITTIEEIDSGTQITVSTKAFSDISTGDSPTIEKINPISINWQGGKLLGGGSLYGHSGLILTYGLNSSIDLLSIDGCESTGHGFKSSLNCHSSRMDVRNCLSNPVLGNTGYGFSASEGTSYSSCSNSYFERCRHSVTGGGTWPTRFVDILKNHSVDGGRDTRDFDCHEPCFYWTFDGNTTVGKNGGFIIRGQYINITNNFIRSAGQTGIDVEGFGTLTDGISNFVIDSNVIDGARTGIIVSLNDSITPKNAVISNNVITNSELNGIRVGSAENIVISGNMIDNVTDSSGADGNGIRVSSSSRVSIFQNTIGNTVDNGILTASTTQLSIGHNSFFNITGSDWSESGSTFDDTDRSGGNVFSQGNFSAATGFAGKSMVVAAKGATAGNGAYGGSIAFARVNTKSPRAAIVAQQTDGNNERVGLSFWTHPSNSSSADMVHMSTIDHDGHFAPEDDDTRRLGLNGQAWSRVYAGGLRLIDGVTAPATETGYAIMYVDAADGDLKIKFGDGTVKTIVTDT